jgi:O-antigen ligase
VYAAFVFSGVALAAFVVGQFPWFPAGAAPLPAQVAELGLFLLSVCLFLAVADQLNSLTELKWLTWLFLAAGLMAAVIQSIPSLAVVGRWTTRPASIGSLFWTWLVALSFAQALFNRHLSAPTRLLLLAINALVLYHGLVQVRSWASGWIPPLAAMGIILLFKIPRLSIGLFLVAAPVALFFAGFISTVLLGDEEYSLMTRQEAWAVLWNLVQRSPLLGTGPANYYYFTENFPILGWYVRFISHNNYQDLLVQTGFLGLLAFVWLSFEIGSLTLRLYRRVPAGFAQAYVIGALGGLIGSLVSGMLGDWIIPFYYNAGILGFRSSLLFWVFLGGILALKRMTLAPVEVPARIHARAALAGDRRSFAEVH